MGDALEQIRKLEAERRRLKEEALAKALEGIAELNAMGFHYELREQRKKMRRDDDAAPTAPRKIREKVPKRPSTKIRPKAEEPTQPEQD